MNPLVLLEEEASRKCRTTDSADKRSLSRVNPLVIPQVLKLIESRLASLASIGTLSGVGSFVATQGSLVTESRFADLTDIRSLSRVDSRVSQHVPPFPEAFETDSALVWLLVLFLRRLIVSTWLPR